MPKGLENIIGDYDYILFADICKEGPGSNIFSSMITTLQQKRKLLSTSRWQFIGAPRTYVSLNFSYIVNQSLCCIHTLVRFCFCFLLTFAFFSPINTNKISCFFQNPLGSCITFLNQGRIENAVMQMLKDDDQ